MSEENEKFAEQIRKLIPINELPPQIQNDIINKANLIQVRKGGFIFKQGDRDDFSFYVLEGEVELYANDSLHNKIVGGTERSTYAMAQLQPRQFSAKAKTASVVFQINRNNLDKLMILHEKELADEDVTQYDLATAEVEVSDLAAEDDVDWMTQMLQSEIFSSMPTGNIHQLFALLEPFEYKTGDIVIKQGDPGTHYYIIQEGRCEVLRKPPSGGKDIKLAVLKAGDSFGEEALITETTRNATVRMISDGVIAKLSKDNFVNLIQKSALKSVTMEEARSIVDAGGKWLDVRFKNEHEKSAIPDSINIPLNMLRMQAEKLDANLEYVLYCDTGGRSSTAAFLLMDRGLDVCYLDGGLVNHPELAPPEEVTQVPKPVKAAEPAPPAAAEVPPLEEEEDITTLDAISKEDLDPDIKASLLDAELARTDQQIKATAGQKSTDKDIEAARAEVERTLHAERAKIEVAKKQAEEESKKIREQEEAKLRQLKENAEKRLQEEKKKLEEVYTRNTQEMEKLEAMKKEAEEKLQADRERLKKQAEEARKNLSDAEKIKKELEASRKAMELEALKRQQQQEEMEKKIQQQAKQLLEQERKKLAAEFAQNNAELEKAKREKEVADTARLAAKAEAEKVIAEFKSQHDVEREKAEAQLREERLKLEEEQRKIQETLAEVKKAREEAEAAKKAAMEEVNRLRSQQTDKAVTPDKASQETISHELKQAEAKISKANMEIAKTQVARVKAESAKKLNAEDLAKKKAMEEELKKQLEADLQEFHKEHEEYQKQFDDSKSIIKHMKRIKEQADAAKRQAKEADQGLLGDIANQLGDK